MNPFIKNRLSVAVTLAVASLSSGSVWAETEAPKTLILEEVVVTGMRASLAKSLDIKRDSIGVVDAIVAEDIGKFPAANVAEALQRIPGVYLSRDGASNEGNRISIRGLGPQNVVTTINGSLVHTTSSSNVGSSTRDFNYDVFPADLFAAAKVYKTPMAELSEGGIGGAVDLQTIRPFDHPEQKITYSATGSYNDASEKVSPRSTLMYSNTWGDFGASVGISVGKNTNIASGYQNTGGINNSRLGAQKIGQFNFKLDYADPRANLGKYSQAEIDNAFLPRFARAYASDNDRDRTSGIFSLQYKNDKLDVSLDGLGSNLKDATDEYTFGVAIRDSGTKTGVKGLVPIDVFIDANNNLQGTFGNATYFAESFIYDSKTEFRNYNLRAVYDLTDTLKLKGQVTTSKSDAYQTNNRIFTNANGITTRIDSSKSSVYPRIVTVQDITDPASPPATDFTNPASWNLRPDVNYVFNTENDKDDSVKLSLEWNYLLGSWESIFKSGVSYVESSKEKTKKDGSAGGRLQALPNGKTFATMDLADFSKYMQNYMPIKPYAKGAGEGFPKTWSTFSRSWIEDFLQPSRANDNAVLLYPASFLAEEDISSFYIQNELHGDVFDRDLKVNLGLRYAETKVIIDNYKIIKSTLSPDGKSATVEYGPNEETKSYDTILPSMNLAYDLSENVILRASAGKTITRANLVDMASVLAIPNVFNLIANVGNPGLKPQLATNYDFTVDWYPDDTSMLSAGVFHKVIHDEKGTIPVKKLFSDLQLPDSAFGSNNYVDGKIPPGTEVTVNTFDNSGAKTVLSGLEISYQLDFKFLPAPYDGFGTLASYTFVDKPSPTDWISSDKIPYEVSFTPKTAYSLTGYYEKGAFSSRMTYSYKGKSINDTSNYADLQRWHAGVGYLDATVGYKFTDYLELKLDALNLNNELAYDYWSNPTGLYGNGDSRRENAKYNGRTFALTVRGSF